MKRELSLEDTGYSDRGLPSFRVRALVGRKHTGGSDLGLAKTARRSMTNVRNWYHVEFYGLSVPDKLGELREAPL